jgi:hypothetical protein
MIVENMLPSSEGTAMAAVVIMGVKWRMEWVRRPRCRREEKFQVRRKTFAVIVRLLLGARHVTSTCFYFR